MISISHNPRGTDVVRRAPEPDEPHPRFTVTSKAYPEEVYRDVAEDEEIQAFLKETDYYDSSREEWSIPEFPTSTQDVVEPLYKILSSIVRAFVKPSHPGVARDVVNTAGVDGCDEENEDGYRTCPFLIVRAAGPSFQISAPPKAQERFQRVLAADTGFSNIATCFSVTTEPELGEDVDEMEILEELASYSREILRAQPNRFYVRSLAITEDHVRLVHFDRAGAQITPRIHIHRNPAAFVRLVAGVSSANERSLGFDNSIQWAIADGRKEKGTVTTTGATGELKEYPILEEVSTPGDSICGRATTCWKVQDPETREELIVKVSWIPEDHTPEHELLELVKGLPGVVQMVSFEVGRGETKSFRCPSTWGRYTNRVAIRIVMKSYGKPIEFFTSVLQVLCALRDAIAAHQRLASDGIRILHRDVSHNNILLGNDGAPDGQRGILIDHASRATDAHPSVKADSNIGTRLFQSISVLRSAYSRAGKHPDHDYLDDLESFFYVLAYLFLVYRPDGSRLPSDDGGSTMVLEWDTDGLAASAGMKSVIQMSVAGDGFRASRLVAAAWGPVCAGLFNEFCDWIFDRRHEKDDLLESSQTVTTNSLSPLLSQCEERYSAVLKMFDDAIQATTASETASVPASTSSSRRDQPSDSHLMAGSENIPSPSSVATGFVEPNFKRRFEEVQFPEAPHTKSRRIDDRDMRETMVAARPSGI